MSAYLDSVERAVIAVFAVMSALLNGALYASVNVFHTVISPLCRLLTTLIVWHCHCYYIHCTFTEKYFFDTLVILMCLCYNKFSTNILYIFLKKCIL